MTIKRVVTPGSLGSIFGFGDGFVGSIDIPTLKGVTISAIFELPATPQMLLTISTAVDRDFIGQQVLIGTTLYRIEDANIDPQPGFTQWTWQGVFVGTDMEDGFNASTTVDVLFEFNSENYITPDLVTPYGNQGTLIGDSVDIDLTTNFTLFNTVTATNLPPGLTETDGVVTGTLTDNTGPFEVLVTATNSIGITEATFTWNTYVGGGVNFINSPLNSLINGFINKGVNLPSHPI